MNIAQYIDELLFEHDCVILPEFGGFVGDYIAAKINAENNVLNPPVKYVLFNKHLTNNDGLLINSIAKRERISYAEASIRLTNFITEIKSGLDQKNRFEVGEVGFFYLDSAKKVCFKHAGKNYSLRNFGLPQFKMEELAVDTVVRKEVVDAPQKKTKVIELKEADTKPEDIKRRNYWWVAAALLPIAFYSTWIPLKTNLLTDSSKFQLSELNPFTYQKADRNYSNQISIQPDVKKAEIPQNEIPKDEYSLFELDETTTYVVKPLIEVEEVKVETTYVEVKKVEEVTKNSSKKGYYVIGGCFSKKSNAENMVSDYITKGYDAEIVDINKDLYRVSISKKNSRKAAKALLKELKKEGVSTWILKK